MSTAGGSDVPPYGEDAPPYGDVAVLVPCHNEALTVASVVRGFHAELPGARVVVCDNNSTDDTAQLARAAGAVVLTERHRGKGFAVRRLFADIDAEFYILVDGDATYDPTDAREFVRLMREDGMDTVLGVRVARSSSGAAEFRRGHQWGNALFSKTFSVLFATEYADVLTGYRGFSRRFVKSCPMLASGFDVEIELNAHGAALAVPTAELVTGYEERPVGSDSKLHTYRDGSRIFRRLFRLFRDFKPMLSFGAIGGAFALAAIVLGTPVWLEFARTGAVRRFPTAFAVIVLLLAALVSVLVGTILERASRDRLERNRLAYLSLAPPWQHSAQGGAARPSTLQVVTPSAPGGHPAR